MLDLNQFTHQLQREALNALVSIQQLVDSYTPEHEKRVAELSLRIGYRLGLNGAQLESVVMAALVHDIGKINIPQEVLNKPGHLSESEFTLIRTHPQTTYDILTHISFTLPVPEIAYTHHEYMDGSGYPRGLREQEIMLEARILTVADIVESMSQERPYRKGLGMSTALQEIQRLRGTRLDANVVDACIEICNA